MLESRLRSCEHGGGTVKVKINTQDTAPAHLAWSTHENVDRYVGEDMAVGGQVDEELLKKLEVIDCNSQSA